MKLFGLKSNKAVAGEESNYIAVTTYRIKQYNSTVKTVVCANGVPVCIVDGIGKTLSNVVSYLHGNTTVDINDGAIKKTLDEVINAIQHKEQK